jgi:hypothetical protein
MCFAAWGLAAPLHDRTAPLAHATWAMLVTAVLGKKKLRHLHRSTRGMLVIEVSLYRLGGYWVALLVLGLLLLAWAMTMDSRWTDPLLVKQRKWLKRFGWGLLALVLLTMAARSCMSVDPVRY